MNKKVFKWVIASLWLTLIMFSILKLFLAENFIAVVTNQRIINIGNFIDKNFVAKITADTLIGIFIMHFYLCACKQVWKLSLIEYSIVFVYSILIVFLQSIMPVLATTINLAAPVILPILLKCKWKQTLVIFVLHHVGQLATVFIRSEELYHITANYATAFIFAFDMYLWLGLYYIYSNIYKEETLRDGLLQHFSVTREKLSSKKKSKE